MAAKLESSLSPAVSDSFVETSFIYQPDIDVECCAYFLELELPPSNPETGLMASGVRIDYRYPDYLPTVRR